MGANRAVRSDQPVFQQTDSLLKETGFLKQFTDKYSEGRGKALIYSCAALMIFAVVAITAFLLYEGLRLFIVDHINPFKFIIGTSWMPAAGGFGALPLICGSLAVTFAAGLLATPIAIGSAIFMTELSKKWGTRIMQPVLEILAGIPSVVYGLIGLLVIVPFMRIHFGGSGFSLLAGALVVGIMILPTITSIAADSINAVSSSLREASYAIGGTKWQTIWNVVLPAAKSNLITAVVLGMSRAFGEALAVSMVVGNAPMMPNSLHSFVDPIATLTTEITSTMSSSTGTQLDALWSLGLILLVISYVFIIIIRFISRKKVA
ncbi:MAG: phosphate ABC transporter permease subunit PstC [Sporolactobacillus sp.]